MDTEELVRMAKKGDKNALVQLIMAQKENYYNLAYAYMGNREDALDVMEDMIVILYENVQNLKKEEAFYSWSKTILVNCCKKTLRKKKKVLLLDQMQEEVYEERFSQKDDEIILEKHLAKLNLKHQEVIKLKYYLDLDYQSIADIVQIPVGTVKSRISTGLKKLKESLGGDNLEASGRHAE